MAGLGDAKGLFHQGEILIAVMDDLFGGLVLGEVSLKGVAAIQLFGGFEGLLVDVQNQGSALGHDLKPGELEGGDLGLELFLRGLELGPWMFQEIAVLWSSSRLTVRSLSARWA